ncbi:uncharacterized protein EV422DRAFT_532957 [Fimicolochytrium jonesii]|uniref:uncharacterized protein n=1 Tax=Fimicolochytrium jonesii TaxID=1396493 RepID=UPI0022FF3BA9|nr:uncharacterized protein EV422DRAFT_532957 [Fimicolochytrium jonesii]KAI8819960.1 hypothetical protein EV422DRAFT_532957 [Fimicolochytrium jonesii]
MPLIGIGSHVNSTHDKTYTRVVKEYTLKDVRAVHLPERNTLVVSGSVHLYVKTFLVAFFVVAEGKLLRPGETTIVPRTTTRGATQSVSADRDVGAQVLWMRDPAGAVRKPEDTGNLFVSPRNCSLDPFDWVFGFEIELEVSEGWTPDEEQRVFVRATVQRALQSDGNYECHKVVHVEAHGGEVLPSYTEIVGAAAVQDV